MKQRQRQLALSVLLAAASIVVTLGALEAGFRLVAFREDERALVSGTGVAPPPGSRARMGQVIQPSAHRRIVFELIPNLDVVFVGAPLFTDDRGFRVGSPSSSSGVPEIRIVGLGDSVMFGWGVGGPETFLSELARGLGERHPRVAWRALNTAVPGYNTVMEVESLRVKALVPPPHLVLLGFVGNDLRLPNFVLKRRPYLSPRRSFLLDFVRSRIHGKEGDLSPHLTYLPRQQRPSDAERVPERYRDLVGHDAFLGALDELSRLSTLHGFAVVVMAHPHVPPFVRQAAEERGFLVVQTGERVRALAVDRGLPGDWEPPLSLTPADPHPSALGHELIGRALLEALEREGLPDRLADAALREREGPASP